MKPKEKAQELIERFTAHAIGDDGRQVWINAKNCALVAVDEIILVADAFDETEKAYWQTVKTEIKQL